MTHREKTIDIELTRPLTALTALLGYAAVVALVRWRGVPLGSIRIEVQSSRIEASVLRSRILDELGAAWQRQLLCEWLTSPVPRATDPEALFALPPSRASSDRAFPLVTVAVCTRDRPEDLAECLRAISALDYPALDLLVVDNAPGDTRTEALVTTEFPAVRYVCEPVPGLDWARNRAVSEMRGALIAFTDDDARVDPGWVHALVRAFDDDPAVMAVTGLVLPAELETRAQLMFESFGGFGRGYRRRWVRADTRNPWQWAYFGTGQFGTGANMAFRRGVFGRLGLFDPALDVGTTTNGGGDLEMLFRVLHGGDMLVYEPEAVVRHKHRRDYAQFVTQIRNNGLGFMSYLRRCGSAFPEHRAALARLWRWWLWHANLRRLSSAWLGRSEVPASLFLTQLGAALPGWLRYPRARRRAEALAHEHGRAWPVDAPTARQEETTDAHGPDASAVRRIDLEAPLAALEDVATHARARLYVDYGAQPLGVIDIEDWYQPVPQRRVRELVVDHFMLRLLDPQGALDPTALWANVTSAMARQLGGARADEGHALDDGVSVSIVVATLDRPDDLRQCLGHLAAQRTQRHMELVVVDNHAASGLTAPVLAEFSGITVVNEPRRGLSYARNAGILASSGKIVIMTDDDVRMPPEWLERLLAPFARPEVMAVTGDVRPTALDNAAQVDFERYGGLGRGATPREFGAAWLARRPHPPPTWEIGATANAAFRASVFTDPQIGLLDEALGAGTPTGCSEDTDLFYRVLAAGHTIVYRPGAWVSHSHRASAAALRRQVYNYSKGHIAYLLTTWLRYGDRRALRRMLLSLPAWRARQLVRYVTARVRRRRPYPLTLIALEVAGNLVGPFSLWRSRRRVRRLGRSGAQAPIRDVARPAGGTRPDGS